MEIEEKVSFSHKHSPKHSFITVFNLFLLERKKKNFTVSLIFHNNYIICRFKMSFIPFMFVIILATFEILLLEMVVIDKLAKGCLSPRNYDF